MTDFILSQIDMLPIFLVLCQRENTKILLRLVLFNIMLFWTIVVTAGNGRDTVYSIFKWDILVTLRWND